MTSVGLLPPSLQDSLHQVMDRVNASQGGIRAILLSTSDGVPLGRSLQQRQQQQQRQDELLLSDEILSSLESTWAPASKQFALLKLGKVQSVTASFDHGTLVHVYQSPVVVTIVLQPNSNLGAIRSTAILLLKQLLDPLCQTLLNSLPPAGDWHDDVVHAQTYYQ